MQIKLMNIHKNLKFIWQIFKFEWYKKKKNSVEVTYHNVNDIDVT